MTGLGGFVQSRDEATCSVNSLCLHRLQVYAFPPADVCSFLTSDLYGFAFFFSQVVKCDHTVSAETWVSRHASLHCSHPGLPSSAVMRL